MKNTKPKLKILQGNIASGKSTAAKELEKQGWVRVNKDTIRKELFGDSWTRKKEQEVVKEETRQITEALESGNDVVVDSTNLNPTHVTRFKRLARELDADMSIDSSFLSVPLGELIQRDKEREETIGEQAIRETFHKWVKKMPTFLEYDPNLEYIVCVDLDSTLTNGPKNRSPYEWHKVGNDEVNLGVAHILDGVRHLGLYKTFIFSGRDEVCRPETEEWLDHYCIDYDELYMRRSDHVDENGNQVSDVIVKSEMIEKYIRGKYNVLFWLDDRPSIVSLLHDVYGINVLARGDQKYNF